MEAIVENDMKYYEFLNLIQDISKKSKSIQNISIKKIYDNYDIHLVKARIDKKIAYFDNLLIK